MQTIQSILEAKLLAAVGDSGGVAVTVQAAQDARHGDYQTNIAMQLAKPRRSNPRAIAQEIIAKLDVADMCETPEIAGAGFINFRLKAGALATHFAALAADARLGVPVVAQRRIVIDFSSPNVAKAMHVGHIRSTFLGDALARIGRFLGHTVVTDNHIGDWGTQFGMLLYGWHTILDEKALVLDPIVELERVYKTINKACSPSEEDIRDAKKQILELQRNLDAGTSKEPAEDAAELEKLRRELPEMETRLPSAKVEREKAKAELVKLQSGDVEYLAIWREMIRLSQVQFDTIYARLGITFDHTLGESHYNPWLKETVTALVESGIARESDGALCVFSDGTLPEKEDPFLIKDENGWKDTPALVQKTDGAANYTTTDLATIAYRVREFAPDEIIYVTDGRQQLHFRQFFAIWRRWQPASAVKLAHVWFGSILGEDGKPFKTRSGDTVKLTDLLDEAIERASKVIAEKNPDMPADERNGIARIIGLGAVKYADLLPNRQGDYVFSWEKMLSFQGNTAPYLQNAYVRIRSIFRKAGEGTSNVQRPTSNVQFTEPAELALVKKLAHYGEVLPGILDDYRPNILCNYLYELAGAFHSFFEACPVLKADEHTRASRLALCEVTARVLAHGLGLLGIEVPERM